MNELINRLLALIGLEVVVVLPPPDRSTKRNIELFDEQAMYIRRMDRSN